MKKLATICLLAFVFLLPLQTHYELNHPFLQGMVWESDDAKRVSLAFLNHTVKAMCLISEQQKTLVDILVARDAQKMDGSC